MRSFSQLLHDCHRSTIDTLNYRWQSIARILNFLLFFPVASKMFRGSTWSKTNKSNEPKKYSNGGQMPSEIRQRKDRLKISPDCSGKRERLLGLKLLSFFNFISATPVQVIEIRANYCDMNIWCVILRYALDSHLTDERQQIAFAFNIFSPRQGCCQVVE